MTEHRRDSFTAFLVAKGRKDGIVSLDSDYGLGTHDVIEACADLTAKQADACLRAAKKILRTDPRDAEIAALKAEVERLKRALAAGPAAVRASQCNDRMDHDTQQISRVLDNIMQRAAVVVERAQEAAMKEEP